MSAVVASSRCEARVSEGRDVGVSVRTLHEPVVAGALDARQPCVGKRGLDLRARPWISHDKTESRARGTSTTGMSANSGRPMRRRPKQWIESVFRPKAAAPRSLPRWKTPIGRRQAIGRRARPTCLLELSAAGGRPTGGGGLSQGAEPALAPGGVYRRRGVVLLPRRMDDAPTPCR